MRRIIVLLAVVILSCGGNGKTSPAVASIALSGPGGATAQLELAALGATAQLSAAAEDAQGVAIPTATFSWSSSNDAVARVGAASGLVTAVANGDATVSVASGTIRASMTIHVAQQVSQVSVGPAGQGLERGATLQLSASATDANAHPIAGALFDWSSDSSAIATVAAGLVTGVGVGSANITASSGGKHGSIAVAVTVPAVASVSITESAPSPLTFLGETLQLHAQAFDARDAAIPEATIAWSTSDSSVAGVGAASGLVSAAANGQATISASAGSFSADLVITVAQTIATVAVSTPGGASALLTAFGAQLTLTAQATDSHGHPLGGTTFAWSGDNDAVATVDAATGVVTAHSNGTAQITASAGGHPGSITVTVQQQSSTTTVQPPSPSIERGATQAFTAASSDANGHPVPGLTPVWSVDSGGIASILQSGVATGLVVGTTQVHAAMGGHTGDASLIVVVPGVAAVTITETAPAALDHLGQTLQLHATATDVHGNAIPEATIGWSSGTQSVATIDPASGLVTAIADGSTLITASAGTKSSSVTVNVVQQVASVSVAAHSGVSTTLGALGQLLQLDATAHDSGGAAVPGVTFTWAICDGATITSGCANSVATISASGQVTARANGSALAQAKASGKSGTLALHVAQLISQVTVTPSSDTIGIGDTRQFAAAAFDANSHPISGTAAPSWLSSKGSVATINSSSGLATATSAALSAADSTQISATISDSGGAHTGTATLTVDPAVHAAARVTITASVGAGPFTALGQQQTLTAQAFDSGSAPIAGLAYAWSSADSTVVSVTPSSTGSPTATMTVVGNGSTIITASGGGKDATLTVSVAQQVSSVTANGAPTTLASVGNTVLLMALDANGHALASGVTWTSCDGTAVPPCAADTIADVSQAGLVTARKNGSARISAQTTLSGTTSTAHLDVAVAQQVAQVTAQSSTTLASFNATVQLSALDANQNPVEPASLTWSSNAPTVASVSGGLVTALANGSATITAQGPHDSGKTIGVTVSQSVATVVTATNGASTTLTSINDTLQLSALNLLGSAVVGATFTGCDGAASPPCATPTIVQVSTAGLVTAKANGSARITARRGSEAGGALAVTVAQQAASVTPSPLALVSLGQQQQLTAFDLHGTAIPSGVTWTACDGSAAPPCATATIASASSGGLVTALANGAARITATTQLGAGTTQAHGDVTVGQKVAQVVTSTQGDSTTLTSINQQLHLSALDANGHPVARALVWQSDATSIATVNSSGLVTAIGNGTAHVTAQGPDDTGAGLDILVSQAVTQVTAASATSLTSFGQTLQLSALDALGSPVAGALFTACDGSAAPPCGTPTITSVSSSGGLVTARANGSARISAKRGTEAGGALAITVAQQVSSLSPGSSTLVSLGQTQQLVAFDARSNAISSGVTITWTACDGTGAPPSCGSSTIASVSGSGLVTALLNGSARISASTVLGGTTSQAHGDVTVGQKVVQVVTSAQGNSTTLGSLGQTLALSAVDANGHPVARTLSWLSDVPAVATVDGSGLVTAVADGTAHVTAQGPDDNGAELDIIVHQLVAQVSPNGASTTLTAINQQLQLEALDARGNAVVTALTWFSDSTGHASVNGTGLVTAVANGSANITAHTTGDAGSQLAVTVAQRAAGVSPSSPSALTSLNSGAGSTVQLSAQDSNGNAISSGVTWTACDGTGSPPCAAATVVSVSSSGLVTAKANGSARVTAAVGGGSGFASISVAQSISSVTVSPPSSSIAVNATTTFTATAKDAGGTTVSGAAAATWHSGSTSIATIDLNSGVATGVAAGGPITITGTISGVPGTAQLTVTAASVLHSINWFFGNTTSANLTINVGDRVQWVITDGGFHSSTSCGSASPPTGCTGGANAFNWNDPAQSGGTLAPVTFTTAGTFTYCCSPHSCSQMKGTITVQ